MHLRVLLVEPDPEDLLFLEEVLLEIEEHPQWHRWVHIEALAASSWMEAAAILTRESVDVVLLNPNLRDSLGVATLRHLQARAPRIPVIVITEADDRDLATHLVREGAQDFLHKKQLDPGPLAHALRNAIERQRRLVAARAMGMCDPLTGLLNREAFLTFAERDRRLAGALHRRWLLFAGELRNISEASLVGEEQRRDLAVVGAGDFLRGIAGSTGLLARISELRFALAILDTLAEPIEIARARIETAAISQGIALGAAILEPDSPASLEALLEQAAANLAPIALAVRR